jgi:pimeloyl-ACP methyl ester carboxylesterase
MEHDLAAAAQCGRSSSTSAAILRMTPRLSTGVGTGAGMSAIALVAGACLGAWAWEHVSPRLTAAGHAVHTITLTGFGDRAHLGAPDTTMAVHATDIAAAIEVADVDDVVLVAHSYAGAPATIAADRIADRIARVVYVAAALPTPGASLFGWRIPVWSDEILDTYFGAHGLSTADRAWMRARAVGQPIANYRDPAPDDLHAVAALPRTYIVCDGDPGDPPVAPGTPGWDVRTIATGHWPMVTRPAELAELIDAVTRGGSGVGGRRGSEAGAR